MIVGGIALALGALLLVKYSIDQGYFGPAMRVLAGLALGLALIGGGEYMRRKGTPVVSPKGAVPIPAVLTAAGTVAAFGAIYAADALYGFIGPTLAFVLLGALAIAAMFAAVLHGPALAGLGLVGALAVPMLVDSHDPSPWPVVPYVAVVCAAAYGLARMRKWLWLACAAGAGAALWQVLLVLALASDQAALFLAPVLVNAMVESALALFVFAVAPHYPTPEAEQATDRIGWIAVAVVALLACMVVIATSPEANASAVWILTATVLAAMLALVGFRLPAVALAAAGAALVVLAALATWAAGPEMLAHLGDQITNGRPPAAEEAFLIFGVAAPLALGALFIFRLVDPARLSLRNSAIYAGAGVLTPLAAVSLLYLRLAHFETSQAFAGLAVGLAVLMIGAATQFQKLRANDASPPITLGLGALASGVFAALALALVFALAEGTLTVALALAALGAAFVGDRLRIPALRWCVLALGVAVAGRMAYDPRIVGDALGKTVVFNWLLFGYGVPALAFGLAARLLRRQGDDAPLRVTQGLTILFSALLFFFEIRHAINGGDPFSPSSGLVEQGLFALVGIGFSIVLMELNARREDVVYKYASFGFGALALLHALIGLLLAENPYVTGASIEGGAWFNGLLLGYALPAIAAYVLARRAAGRPPRERRILANVAAAALAFAYLNLELRRLFHDGGSIGFAENTSDGEFYAYSAVWLVLGALLLAYGVVTRSKVARLASAALVSITVLKVFILDLAGLEGVLRAFSFLGLGAALIVIGLVYQRLVFASPPAGVAPSAGEAPASGPTPSN